MRACFPLAVVACLLPASFSGQTRAAGATREPARRAATSGAAAAGATAASGRAVAGSGTDSTAGRAALAVTKVSLYKNGVGFFEHATRVTGDAAVVLELTTAQLNDALQTLTAVDLGGGRITGANYNSTTPLEQQLGNLPFSLGANPGEDDLYTALKGAEVEVTGAGPVFRGRVLALDVRDGAGSGSGGGDAHSKSLPERRVLTVVAENGAVRSLELTPATTVRVLDGGMRGDLNTYLRLLDRNRSEGIRRLVLTDHGAGSRELRVSFLAEVPVWKSTYRVLLTGGAVAGSGTASGVAKTATLQGYSVVDNTTGEDWNGVQLSLVAGSPQSFVQPLAQPIYDRRPEVPIAKNAQMTPQLHDSGIGVEPPPGTPMADLRSTAGGNPTSLFGSPTGSGDGPAVTARGRALLNMMKDTGPTPAPMAMASATPTLS